MLDVIERLYVPSQTLYLGPFKNLRQDFKVTVHRSSPYNLMDQTIYISLFRHAN